MDSPKLGDGSGRYEVLYGALVELGLANEVPGDPIRYTRGEG